MNMSIAKSRRIIIGRLNIKTYTSEVQREIGLYLINKIHFRYAVTDPPKQQRRPEYRLISQLSDLEPKDRQYCKVIL